ncbi:endonuclease dU [Haloparvum sedimenti]|uniref:endonuclease dU n=1 Tax=Haloparvum sedimenti TaxID=1678448 RepID=UPI00071E6B16|nr:DUF99 family protein [Haloparvum sedimenti]
MKPGSRSLGVAFRDADERSRIAGAVVRTDGVLDGLAYGGCSVGGRDATASVAALFDRLDREDVHRVLCAGVAPAWFNLIDLEALHETVDRPVLSVSFEESEGLAGALREQFSGDALEDRLAVYRSLPPRRAVAVGDRTLYVRAVGTNDETAAAVVRELTREGHRPEPVRAARIAARAYHDAPER